MQRSLCAYLQDILDAAQAIHEFSDGMQMESFGADDLVRSAVERKFEIIGEALRQASQFFPGSIDSVPDLRDAVNQRNRIAHGISSRGGSQLQWGYFAWRNSWTVTVCLLCFYCGARF
jgi:uncharacterized protein with HEPN domain